MPEKRTWFLLKNQDDTWTLALTAENAVLPSPDDPYLIITQEELQTLAYMLKEEQTLPGPQVIIAEKKNNE